ncbi:unnamed protein product [Protopolystoma xenopodis]|uniref:Uncharacterized protein n=1 Tax=Protopolystoma xenopodis TaxID=117903 RepID=A0A3S5ATY8_9PLAT|nr:unnamed protein product [Protopolystoma xenopodis]
MSDRPGLLRSCHVMSGQVGSGRVGWGWVGEGNGAANRRKGITFCRAVSALLLWRGRPTTDTQTVYAMCVCMSSSRSVAPSALVANPQLALWACTWSIRRCPRVCELAVPVQYGPPEDGGLEPKEVSSANCGPIGAGVTRRGKSGDGRLRLAGLDEAEAEGEGEGEAVESLSRRHGNAGASIVRSCWRLCRWGRAKMCCP